ncbi:hypothetical protein BGZ97_002159 [Linnemannia gamsii]|uniref:Crinkler effector protein N-terminal domain-containing protein n=1 Tax=Linnemannia gamsii TaxID=64522 RepID=A0A9P6QXN4_9FUNG|nr:hypothetical protein BGZ97_002159 [Linnemannia gamsii]
MADEYITLLCLIEGEGAANTFSVEIECTKTIGDLKKRIKSGKAPTFDDIAADELALWSVSIPIVPTSMQNPVVLNEVAGLPSPTELVPTISMALLKELPTDTIHILVQRPPRAQSSVNVRGSGSLSAQLSEASHAGE